MARLTITQHFVIAESDLAWSATRSSGPGGQNVNKVNSKVTLRWTPVVQSGFDDAWLARFLSRHGSRLTSGGELLLSSDQYRDQHKNLAEVRRRLIGMLLQCRVPPKVRKESRPTLGSNKRRLESKSIQGEKKRLRRHPSRDD